LGCDAGSPALTGLPPANSIAGKSTVIDVGVVLHERPGYLCLPLEHVGLKADDAIVSVASSCECIEPRLVQYVGSYGASKPAIFLEYAEKSEDSGSKTFPQPMNLSVAISVELPSGKTHDFTVKLLHAALVAVDSSSEVHK